MHAWYTCIHSSIMQTSPSHMPVHSPYFAFGQLACGPQAEWTPPNQTHEQHYSYVERVSMLHHSAPWSLAVSVLPSSDVRIKLQLIQTRHH